MAINNKVFRQELYIEHLEEASYLYETRVAWLVDDEVGWQDLERIDETIEAHIDALMVGEELALAACIESLAEADFATLHAIVRVFCRHRLIEHLAKLWGEFDFDDQEKIRAVADALKWECPPEWFPHLLAVFKGARKDMFPVLAPSVAYCNMRPDSTFLQALERTAPEHLATMIRAISLTTETPQLCSAKLAQYVNHVDEKVAAEAAYALLRLGYSQVVDQCRAWIKRLPHVVVLGGQGHDVQLLLQLASTGVADGDCLIALGLCGDPQAVPILLGYLKHPDYAPMAALGLQLISGANLYDDIHVPDPVTEDELFEEEVAPFKEGQLPPNIDGNPYGSEVSQLSINQDAWSAWFEKNKQAFNAGIRYRNGRVLSPAELVVNLIDNQMPYSIRELVYQELIIRYKLDIPFESDDLISRQKLALNAIHKWAGSDARRFNDGGWYFAGQSV